MNATTEIENPGRDDDPSYAIRLEIIDGPSQETDADGWDHYAYSVRLHFDGRTLDSPWRQGTGITQDPAAEDVLESLLMDASSYDNARSFEDWAADYGFDTDSRKAFALFERVGELRDALETLLGDLYERAVFPTDDADNETATKRLVRSGRVA